jgi:hypothetical protein
MLETAPTYLEQPASLPTTRLGTDHRSSAPRAVFCSASRAATSEPANRRCFRRHPAVVHYHR